MYTKRKNGTTYTLLPIDAQPAPQPSSFYQYHYPPSEPPRQESFVNKSATLTSTSQLSFDIFQANGRNDNNTMKLRTREDERARLVTEKKRKPPMNIHFIYLVTIADLVVFAISIYMNGGFEPFSINPMLGPSSDVLLRMGANYDQKILMDGQWWRFVTPIFLHAGLIHLVFNLMFQIQQGVPLEKEFGSLRVGLLYMLAGITGSLMSSIFLPTVLSVGASGALFGLMGAMLAAMVKNWKILRRPCLGIIFLSLTIAFNLFIGLLPHVDNFAHVGGLLAGFLFGLAFIPSPNSSFVNGFLACFGFMTASIGLCVGFYLFYTQFDMHDWCTGCRYIDCLPVLGWCDDQYL